MQGSLLKNRHRKEHLQKCKNEKMAVICLFIFEKADKEMCLCVHMHMHTNVCLSVCVCVQTQTNTYSWFSPCIGNSPGLKWLAGNLSEW